MSVAMVLLSQWNVQGIILTYVTKLYFIEVPPTFATPAMDDSLSHRFCSFRPNVNFRNHEVGSEEWACRLWHTQRARVLWQLSWVWTSGVLSVGHLPYGERLLLRDRQLYTRGFEL